MAVFVTSHIKKDNTAEVIKVNQEIKVGIKINCFSKNIFNPYWSSIIKIVADPILKRFPG